MPLLRHFLRTSNCADGEGLLHKACVDCEPAAIQLLLVCLKVRTNRRTRRSYADVQAALQLAVRPQWLRRLARGMFSVYKALELLPTKILPLLMKTICDCRDKNTCNMTRKNIHLFSVYQYTCTCFSCIYIYTVVLHVMHQTIILQG